MKSRSRFKITMNAPVILGFSLICFISLIVNILTNGVSNRLFFSVYRSSFASPLTYWRFLGHVIGHANFEHFIGNFMMILVVGPLLEEKYGSKKLLVIMIVTAVITGLTNFLFFPTVQLLGASGIVFAFILLASLTSLKDGEIPLTFIIVAVLYLGQQIYQGIFVNDNVSNLTHILGGTIGSGMGFLLNKNSNKGY